MVSRRIIQNRLGCNILLGQQIYRKKDDANQ